MIINVINLYRLNTFRGDRMCKQYTIQFKMAKIYEYLYVLSFVVDLTFDSSLWLSLCPSTSVRPNPSPMSVCIYVSVPFSLYLSLPLPPPPLSLSQAHLTLSLFLLITPPSPSLVRSSFSISLFHSLLFSPTFPLTSHRFHYLLLVNNPDPTHFDILTLDPRNKKQQQNSAMSSMTVVFTLYWPKSWPFIHNLHPFLSLTLALPCVESGEGLVRDTPATPLVSSCLSERGQSSKTVSPTHGCTHSYSLCCLHTHFAHPAWIFFTFHSCIFLTFFTFRRLTFSFVCRFES